MRALICAFVSPAYFSSCQALMQLHPHICRGLPPPIGLGPLRGPGARDSRLINHGAWVMTPHCSPNVFWREPLPLALISRRHTYGRSEWVTGPLLRVRHPARRKPSAPCTHSCPRQGGVRLWGNGAAWPIFSRQSELSRTKQVGQCNIFQTSRVRVQLHTCKDIV